MALKAGEAEKRIAFSIFSFQHMVNVNGCIAITTVVTI
jgi:hypothetical protein